jgi:hypothetical protein
MHVQGLRRGHRRFFPGIVAILVGGSAGLMSLVHAQAPDATAQPKDVNSTATPAPATPPPTAPAPAAPAPVTAAPAADASAGSGGTPATVVDSTQVYGILGKDVRSSSGESMGRIVDIIIDTTSRVRAAVIDFGGFLGVGSRQIAVDWSMLRFPADGKSAVTVDLTRDQLRVAPAYKAGEQIVLLGRQDAADQRASATSTPPAGKQGAPPAADPAAK